MYQYITKIINKNTLGNNNNNNTNTYIHTQALIQIYNGVRSGNQESDGYKVTILKCNGGLPLSHRHKRCPQIPASD